MWKEINPGHGGLRSKLKDSWPLEVDIDQGNIILIGIIGMWNVTEEKTGECSATKSSPKTQQVCGHGMTGDCTLCRTKNISYMLNHKSDFLESASTTSSTKEEEEIVKLQE